ncbi:DNA cytosine methyltransferase [Pseudoduganella aquatica]|uniref:DNA cytosine methyltransferase n=1 Tax=Pseudoduganella aquatica TaxID=2660641 RepID=UPI002AA2A739|nr:DNA cytosine methyltransferase [Pseudoduganella aquatica]
MEALGYSMTPMIIDAADHGAPRHRSRLFIAGVRAKHPLWLAVSKRAHIPASSFIDFATGSWQLIEKPGRASATLARIAAGRAQHGERFISSFYGNSTGGHSIARAIGTITTKDRHAITPCRLRTVRQCTCLATSYAHLPCARLSLRCWRRHEFNPSPRRDLCVWVGQRSRRPLQCIGATTLPRDQQGQKSILIRPAPRCR